MINVLIVAGVVPTRPTVLVEALEQFRARGAHVSIACYFDSARLAVDENLAEARSLPEVAKSAGAAFRTTVKRAERARQVWLHAQRDPWVRERVRKAQVLVALDQHAVHTVWQLAQRHRRSDAVYGLRPAIRAVERRAQHPSRFGWRDIARIGPSPRVLVSDARGRVRDAARVVAVGATGQRIMRTAAGSWLWSRLVTAPALPDRMRGRLALRVHKSLILAGRSMAAARAAGAAAQVIQDPPTRADMLTYEATAEMAAGLIPPKLAAAIAAQLVVADREVAKHPAVAAKALGKARMLATNRVLHFDRTTSPLAEDPDGFLAPFRTSVAAQRASTPRGRARPHTPPPPGQPHRLLFVTLINSSFLTEIRSHYEGMPGVEVRFLDIWEDESRRRLARGAEAIMTHVLAGQSPYGAEVEEWLRPHLDWADTIFVDWCSAAAALFTLHDPGTTRIVIRLHSFEIFTLWPHLVDFSRVDDVIFVSDHLRDLSTAVLPHLLGDHAPRLSVISNAMELQRFPRAKLADARFNLGLVGIGAVHKDPRWALGVLRLLREEDSRYRLFLVGSELDRSKNAATEQYAALLERDLADLERSGAVVRVGQTRDVPGTLVDVGVILSSSIRESFHCALVEGAASGAIPVVRDWPFFARRAHGARTLFPEDWVVETQEEAVKRILAATGTEDGWRAAGQAASDYAIKRWDWNLTQRQFDQLLLGALPAKNR